MPPIEFEENPYQSPLSHKLKIPAKRSSLSRTLSSISINTISSLIIVAAFIQVGYDFHYIWDIKNVPYADICILASVLIVALIAAVFFANATITLPRLNKTVTGFMFGNLIGIFIAQPSFPQNTYYANSFHYLLICLPLQFICGIIFAIVVYKSPKVNDKS